MMAQEHDLVILTCDLPDHGLQVGDIGTVILANPGDPSYEVEFMTMDGETIAVVHVQENQIRGASKRDLLHARTVA